MTKKQKLELTWVGKENRPRLEPRILIEDPAKSHHAAVRVSDADIFDNVLIHGDNLLALKALEADYAGKVKCVYIDPPYNTGNAFKHYDDGLEHSIWLGLMRDRIEILRNLLSADGALFVQADDREGHYLKVLCDEIFGRINFISTFLWRKVDSPNDNKVPVTPDHEFIYGYAKDIRKVRLHQKADPELLNAYRGPDEDGRYFRDRLLKKNGKNSLRTDRPTMWFPVIDPDGRELYPLHDDGREACWALGKTSVQELVRNGELIWKNRGVPGASNWIPYTREYAKDAPTRPYNSLWTDLPTTRQTKAHQKDIFGAGNEFDTPKPEPLIERILSMCTIVGDLVLDSFAGSGTTGAAAHKMGRRWIMVELEATCDTHILPRLCKVINGDDQGGISKTFEWQGGGGFRYFNLATSLLVKDKWDREVISSKYDAAMLAQAICKLEGFTYAPSDSVYWQQGHSSESDFLYVTTQTLGPEELAALSEEVGEGRSLLILCAAFRGNADLWPNLTLRKIPNHIRSKCEWGHDDYSLNVANLPMAEKEPPPPPPAQSGLFDVAENEGGAA
jgi:adenine-specific DNA-methyltransferase